VPVVDPGPLLRRSDLSVVIGAALAQTPQVFRGDGLLDAYAAATGAGFVGSDTAEVVRRFGTLEIAAVEGDPDNIKVTGPEDMERIRSVLGASRSEPR
jgi:2-C-methyl-D-erythritol 4-phosphate cytidylyltransferase